MPLANINDVLVEDLTIEELSQSQSEGTSSEYFLVLPKYQRGVVWSPVQKKKLIESISLGFPVGSLLGFNTGDTKLSASGKRDRPVIELVDGLQRTNTIVEFMREPLKLLGVDVLFDKHSQWEIAEKLFTEPQEADLEKIRRIIELWLEETKVIERKSGFTASKIKKQLFSLGEVQQFDEKKIEELEHFLEAKLDEVESLIRALGAVRIPIVIYRGSEDNIPEIFERINSQGIKLSKYEKFAASWMRYETQIDNPDVRNFIRSKYQSLRNRGFEIVDFPEDGEISSGYNLFEYMFGLGKDLADKHPYLFPESSDPEDAPSSAFVLTTVAMGIKIAEMVSLARECQLRHANPNGLIDLQAFELSLRDSCKTTEDILRPVLKVKLNNQGDERFLPHSANQINSVIVRILLETHDTKTWRRRTELSKKFRENIRCHYVFDILQGAWAGSGDSRLFEMCWHSENGSKTVASSYTNSISYKTMSDALTFWHQNQLSKKQRSRSNIQGDAKFLLRLLYAHKLSVYQDDSEAFDLEHLYPVSDLIKRIQESGDEGWPISALGNLCLLPRKLNRIKQENYLGDFLSSEDEGLSDKERKSIQELVGHPDVVEILRDPELTLAGYLDFCNERFEWQRMEILSNLGLSQNS